MDIAEQLVVHRSGAVLSIDAREAIRNGFHPRHEILQMVDQAPFGTLCEIHTPHRPGPLISAIKGLGLNVVTTEVEPGHWRLRVMKM
ncbi:hypothetical protein Alches_28240 [Alicyclobacillus hesperidum subsp. aegles]|uniref:amino acid decarboxylase n=1 Tax=Alicyclobacillus hesperidum TaxID=89784 RepID=UPI002228AF0C|nr:amino acid decarboxylase [Alicyclobacillus hesperidum]GLG02783.1 hypothetical protein Alches_28240 [Alicyclobacillus hesperidum subsp. aegles]